MMGYEDDAQPSEEETKPLSAAKLSKRPPPETSESSRLRGLVIVSFWAVVIFLGIPIWLWTTSVYRARLPLDHMLAWAHGKVQS